MSAAIARIRSLMQMYTDDTRECMFFIHFLQPLLFSATLIMDYYYHPTNTIQTI